MKSDFEILHEYINKYNKEFYERLSFKEQFMYAYSIRDTLSFKIFLLRYRILEFCNTFVECMKKNWNLGE